MVICDSEPLTSVGDYIYRETGIPSRTLANITLSLLINIVEQSMNSINSLDALTSSNKLSNSKSATSETDDFLEKIRDKIISRTADFIDTRKAMNILKTCLENTLNDLSIPYSASLAVKYICHGTNMLERAIRKETWEYPKISRLYSNHAYLMHVVEHRLEYAGSSFGVKIPASEIAYIAEIFLQDVK